MSYTAVASRDQNFNLNIFSHPPVKSQPQQPQFYQSNTPPSAPFSDDEDIFDLDMVTMDMDFEQAYSMYTQIQQKNAISEVESLQKAQLMQQQQHHNQRHESHSHPRFWPGAQTPVELASGQFSSHIHPNVQLADPMQPTVQGHPMQLLPPSNPVHSHHSQMGNISVGPQHVQKPVPQRPDFTFDFGPKAKKPRSVSDITDVDDSVDSDQFFSITESDALQKFLDNLAYSVQVNPLDFYAKDKDTGVAPMPEQRGIASITPPDSAAEEEPRKRRKASKPLLSVEQKRLNHSHSEQKRRLLCKEAYERCLRLITNVDDYRNDLVSARSVNSSKKKSKRRQLNKAGLPNLSKHSALVKISGEIEKISAKNDVLRRLAGI